MKMEEIQKEILTMDKGQLDTDLLKQLGEMFARNEVSIAPNVAYKKSVNFLKSKTKKR